MNLLEHQAKRLLEGFGVTVPRSWLVKPGETPPQALPYPLVAKSQVPVGGRGKAGGIVAVESAAAMPGILQNLFALEIKGFVPSAVLLEEKLPVTRELYLTLRLNRDRRALEWLASPDGGIDIETHPDSVQAFSLSDGYEGLAKALSVSHARLEPVLNSLVNALKQTDLLLLEINPLIEGRDGRLVCADAKLLVDDNARFRQPDLPWPPEKGNLPTPLGGTIGCIANGAGMAMSTMDTIVSLGGKPANFLDIGGGTGEKEFVTALKNIMALPGVTSIIVNIFAGISRCDEIARGILAAKAQLPDLPPLFVRLEGTNRDSAVSLLQGAIDLEPDLKTCVQKAMTVGE